MVQSIPSGAIVDGECVFCGKTFRQIRYVRKTCSKACHSNLKRQQRTLRCHGHLMPPGTKYCCRCKQIKATTEFSSRSRGACRPCSSQYDVERSWKLKKFLVAAFGGKCSLCGYDKSLAALDFHHTDPSLKGIPYTKIRKMSFSRALAQLQSEKVICLCSNCHREHHWQEGEIFTED